MALQLLLFVLINGLILQSHLTTSVSSFHQPQLHQSHPSGRAEDATNKLKLVYFDARGVAELSRILMRISGVDFEDRRFPIRSKEGGGFEVSAFQAAKLRGDFRANLDRVPVLHIGDTLCIGQSRAIERYLANTCGLMGSSEEERAAIDCIVESVRDVKDAWGKIRSTGGFAPTAEKLRLAEKWFAGGELAEWLQRLDRSLPPCSAESAPFAVGGRLSYADLSIWHLLRDYFHMEKDEMCVAEKQANCHRLTRVADAVSELPALRTHLQSRPHSLF